MVAVKITAFDKVGPIGEGLFEYELDKVDDGIEYWGPVDKKNVRVYFNQNSTLKRVVCSFKGYECPIDFDGGDKAEVGGYLWYPWRILIARD